MMKQVTCVEIEGLLPAMAAGALDADEAQAAHSHLAICPPCLVHLRDFQAAVEQLAFAVPQVAPPAELRSRVLYSVAHSPAPLPAAAALPLSFGAPRLAAHRLPTPAASGIGPLYQRLAPALLAACLLLLVGMGVWAGTLRQQVLLQQQRLQAQTTLEEILHTPGATLALLTAPGNSPAHGQAVLAPRRQQVALLLTNLPQPAAGRGYQLWLLRRNAPPVPAGMFNVDAQGVGMVMVDTTAEPADMAGLQITDEPAAGGSPAPTGTAWLAGWYR
ncbi:MAG: anti-sigma factor [Chloroflexota bacterium]|nr:anti-sigma factor [Chloroflexota bacterium]